MKKTVFLILFFTLFISVKQVTAGVESDSTFEFSGYNITLSRVINGDNIKGYNFDKVGTNPFSTTILIDDTSISVEDIKEINGNHVLFGHCHIIGAETYYDAFIIVLSPTGDEISRLFIDKGELETMRDVFAIDNQIVLCIEQSYSNDRGYYMFDTMIYQIYDLNYLYIDEITSDVYPESLSSSDRLLLINTDHSTIQDYGMTPELEFITDYGTTPVIDGAVYHESVTIDFLNVAILNNQLVYNGIIIDYPGNYRFLYKGISYYFTVTSGVSGVEDGQVYNRPVQVNVSGGNLYLNDDIYISGTDISKPGNYQLKIIGVNDYSQTYDFTVTSNITGVIHNQTYSDTVELSFSGIGYLNNTYIESPYTVINDGEYILKIQGENNYSETIYFNIERSEDDSSVIDFVQKYDVIFLVVVVVSGGIVLKKK